MKKLLSFLTIIFALTFTLKAQEISLYDESGEPIAYIDTADEEIPVYLWNGSPVAYLEADEEGAFNIYGYNGLHLGWLEEGLVRNHEGLIVGFQEGTLDIFTQREPFKRFKEVTPFKSFQKMAPFKPLYYDRFSSESLMLFFLKGGK